MKTIARKWLVLFILAVCVCAFSAPHTVQAASCKKAAVKNVTVRKKGGKYDQKIRSRRKRPAG